MAQTTCNIEGHSGCSECTSQLVRGEAKLCFKTMSEGCVPKASVPNSKRQSGVRSDMFRDQILDPN
eukprot:10312890-Prorocentrum_lima.AAC.1